MIATLSGVVSEKLADIVIVDAGGVGYGVYVTAEDHGRLVTGSPARIYVYEHIREQAHDLYGFLARDTKDLFEQLLGVNGIGPKVALNMLSIGTAQDVRQAIAAGNVKFLQRASGVGKRVAERLVVELKDKVGLASVDLQAAGLLQSESALRTDEAAEALMSLGYTAQDAARALEKIDPQLPVEERVTRALKGGNG
jgi:holliday junction DNA helicase RuvA